LRQDDVYPRQYRESLAYILFDLLLGAAGALQIQCSDGIGLVGGGGVGLYLSGEYLSVPASVGFIAVWGTSILNGVVLIEFIRTLRFQGLSVPEAVRKGCEQRFRPVLMTAATTVLGLAPFLAATGLGSEVQKPLAIVVISGLITATMMTMILMPMLYRWFDDQPKPDEDVVDDDAGPRLNLIGRIRSRFRKSSPATGI
jgi:cobalt-zinc-cadmium resistance protein CzcA